MNDSPDRFRLALERIDAAHAEDPDLVVGPGGANVAAELAYARRMTSWLDRLEPGASEALRLAVRCQHLRRWTISRSQYPMTRAGYHQWRTTLARFHADEAATLLRGAGYDDATVARVQSLVRKEGLKTDPETQTLEDVACLVFLQDEFGEFARKHDEVKVLAILRRTWGKMSERGRATALGLELGPGERALVEKALAGPAATVATATAPTSPEAPRGAPAGP